MSNAIRKRISKKNTKGNSTLPANLFERMPTNRMHSLL